MDTSLDSSLIRLFILVYENHSLRQAAARFPMSPARASRGLARLRAYFNDPLFISSKLRFYPTSRATTIYPKLRHMSEEFENLKNSGTGGFSPASYCRMFNIALLDDAAVTLLVPVVDRLALTAPNVRINSWHLTDSMYFDLAKGKIDFCVYPTTDVFESYPKAALYTDSFVYLCHRDSALARRARSGERISEREARKNLVAHATTPVFNSDNTELGQYIENVNSRTLNNCLWAPYFSTLPYFIRGERTTCIPFLLARAITEIFPVEIIGRPASIDPYTVYLIWHRERQSDPGHQWLRSVLLHESRTLAADCESVGRLKP